MNERIRKYFISAMALCCALLLVFPFCVRNVNAEVSSVNIDVDNPADLTNISDLLKEWPSSGVIDVSGYATGAGNYNYYRLRLFSNSNSSGIYQPVPNNLFFLMYEYSNTYHLMLFRTGFPDADRDNNSLSSPDNFNIALDRSYDGVNWSSYYSMLTSYNYYKGTGLSGYSYYVNYKVSNDVISYLTSVPNYPLIHLKDGQDQYTILQVLSYRLTERPWKTWSDSSGGLHFENGTQLTSEERSRYEQIFIVMDVNHDNSVSQEEVNYYNVTYNTNYDYSEINEGNNFTEMQFLEYIALLFSQGVENPGGGTGDGGGSGSVGGGGITVTDSFTQSQTQTIEENAVNVTVNNNNSLSQENVQTLENFIELNLGEQQENAFAEAVGGISRFIGVGQAFAGLVTAVLGFLPAWTITLLGVLFTIIFVMIVFRLLHVFL